MNVILAELQPLIMATLRQKLAVAEIVTLSITEPTALLDFVLEYPETLIIYDAEMIDEGKRKFYHKIRHVQQIPMLALMPRRTDFDQENGCHLAIIKPFDIKEIILKCQNVQQQFSKIQKNQDNEQRYLIHGELLIDFHCHEVSYQNQAISLSAKEFAVLCHLAKQPNTAIMRETLLSEIWGNTRTATDLRTVDHQIKGLRKKLEHVKADIEIKTIYRQGYQLTLLQNQR